MLLQLPLTWGTTGKLMVRWSVCWWEGGGVTLEAEVRETWEMVVVSRGVYHSW